MPMTLTKGNKRLSIVAAFPDGTKLIRLCDCPECLKLDKKYRVELLPCGCHDGEAGRLLSERGFGLDRTGRTRYRLGIGLSAGP